MEVAGDNLGVGAGETHRIGARGFAALSLFAANTGMLFLYFAFDLSLFEVVVVYWFEALWIGLYSGLKLLTAALFGDPFENRWVDVDPFSALLLSLYAIAKAGFAFLFLIVITGIALVVANEGLTGTPGNDFVAEQGQLLLQCSLLFVVGHGLSFIINFVVLGEFRHARFGTLLWLPFKRAAYSKARSQAASNASRQRSTMSSPSSTSSNGIVSAGRKRITLPFTPQDSSTRPLS